MRGALVAGTLVTAEVAGAAESVCEGADVRIEGRPDTQWSDVLGRLCADLRAMNDRDPNATVRLVTDERDLIVEVTLADGRSAIRRVKRPLALREVLDALLTLPPSPAPAAVPPPRPQEPLLVAPPPAPAPPPVSAPRAISAELALSGMGRVAGAGFVSAGGAAEGYLTTGRWLFGLQARWEAYQHADAPKQLDYEIETVGAGVAVARQITLGSLELDIGFAPRLLVETESFEVPVTPTPEDDDTEDDRGRSTTDVRLAPFARALFGSGPFRFFVGADAELSPARLRRKVRASALSPALPAWSAGISLGVSWTAQ